MKNDKKAIEASEKKEKNGALNLQNTTRFNGKVINKKKLKRVLNAQKMGMKNKAVKLDVSADPDPRQLPVLNAEKLGKNIEHEKIEVPTAHRRIPVEGNRIIDLNFMLEQMKCMRCKSNLGFRDVEKETLCGLGSIFHLKCPKCMKVKTLPLTPKTLNPKTGKNVFSINTKAVLGTF